MAKSTSAPTPKVKKYSFVQHGSAYGLGYLAGDTVESSDGTIHAIPVEDLLKAGVITEVEADDADSDRKLEGKAD